ncbi:MAG: DUF1592 domain-containing protein [Verrucomicrobiota bacterium]
MGFSIKRHSIWLCTSLLLSALLAGRAGAADPTKVPSPQARFLEAHCFECHDAEVKKGNLDLTALKFDLKDPAAFDTWVKVHDRVRDGVMPPAKKPRPDKNDATQFLANLEQPLLEADRADIAARGRVRSRRLTRVEYEHTMHDLLGIDIPLKDLLPEDPASHGFETVADGQQLSHHQLARYLDVADRALTEAFKRALNGDATFERKYTPEELARVGRGNYRGPDLRDGKSISWPITLQFFGRMPVTEVPADGWYRVTVRGVHAINPGRDGAVWGTLRSGACASSAPMLYLIGLVEATPKPRDLVFEAWIQKNHMLELKPNDAELRRAQTGATGGNVSFKGRDLERDGFSGIAHRGIEMKRIYPNASREAVRRRLFGDVNVTESSTGATSAVEPLVAAFAQRAFRRPVTPAQAAPYQEIARKALQEGESLADALRISYRAILCSPRFLTFIEPPGKLDDYAIASRLSYAFWISMPDAELLKLAAAGQLRRPEVLSAQIERLLADKKSDRFIRSFTDQWLKLKEIDFTSPDTRQFRTFDPVLQESMVQETRAYVTDLIKRDRSISHLVDSEFTFANGRLARHYGLIETTKQGETIRRGDNQTTRRNPQLRPISLSDGLIVSPPPLKPGNGLQRVALTPDSTRGGLLTQGAILKVTADGTSTSPVVRGVFINERILGERIPPPPPGVPAIEPDIRGATSIRDQLDKHRSNPSCASCHITIDPPGFALENFDPIGGWRTRYGDGKGVPVNPQGITPDGREFADLQEWKKIYSQRREQLARGFAEHFLTYATGAPMRFSDAHEINKIIAQTKASDYGVQSIIRAALGSNVFLNK